MADPPKIQAPATLQGAGPATTPQQSAVPQVYMDPTTEKQILSQLQRSGWTAAAPQPNIEYVSNGIGGVQPVVKGYKMVISDPATGATDTVALTYDASAPGKGAQWGIAGDVGVLPKAADVPHLGDSKTGYYTQSGPVGANGQRTWVQVVPPDTPNADDEMKKALERIDRQQEMAEKQANDAAGRGYMTTQEYQTLASKYANDALGQSKLAEDIRQFNATQA